MEISELRGSLSRVEHALVDSPPKEQNQAIVPLQTPGNPTPMQQSQRIHINRTGSVSFNAGSAFRRGPIRATPLSSSTLGTTLGTNAGKSATTSSSSSSSSSSSINNSGSTTTAGPVQVHVSRRGSIDISSTTPLRSTTVSTRGGPSPAAQRVRDRLANVRAQFANLRNN
jgi:hypothetical protein